MMGGTDSWLQINKVKAGQPIDGVPHNGVTDATLLYAYMDWDLDKYVLHGLQGLNPDSSDAIEIYNVINKVFRWWPMVLNTFVKEYDDCADSGRSMWPEETGGPVNVLKTDGYVVYVCSNERAFDLRWIIGNWSIRMDHETTRGFLADVYSPFDGIEALTRVYEAGSMLSEIWQRVHELFKDARERGSVLVSDGSLDLS